MANRGQEISKAWKRWRDSGEGKHCADHKGIGTSKSCEPYIVNRLERAFIAGFDAADSLKGENPDEQ